MYSGRGDPRARNDIKDVGWFMEGGTAFGDEGTGSIVITVGPFAERDI
jgi:hypothetical protein